MQNAQPLAEVHVLLAVNKYSLVIVPEKQFVTSPRPWVSSVNLNGDGRYGAGVINEEQNHNERSDCKIVQCDHTAQVIEYSSVMTT